MVTFAFRIILLVAFVANTSVAEDPKRIEVELLADLPYRTRGELSEYERERCKLDVYLPKEKKDFATLIWFHGGGLKNGDKSPKLSGDSVDAALFATSFAEIGIAVVVPNYRLSPKATFPAYIQDAAAAVMWVKQQMPKHGGDSKKVFVGGHSAGGYLALMLAMDPHYLTDIGAAANDIAGVLSVSGQTMTHYTVREERGIGKHTITADEAAPVYFARADTPPILALYADGDLPARAEENAYFVALMKDAKNKRIIGQKIQDRNHSTIASEIKNANDPTRKAMLEFMLNSAPK